MKCFISFTIVLLFGINVSCFSQDIVKTIDGKEIKARVLKIKKKDIQYKLYEDPEFTTYSLKEKELDKVILEKGKKQYWFNHKLPRAYIAFNLGLSSPLGNFSRTDFNGSGEPGFAKIGAGVGFTGGFYFTKRIGLAMKFNTSFYQQNFDAISKIYEDPSDTGQHVSVNYNGINNDQYGKNWNITTLMIGPMYSFKLAKWLTWDFKVIGGPVAVSKPELNILVNRIESGSSSSYYNLREESSSKTDFGYEAGTAFRFSPIKRIAFFLSIDYRSVTSNLDIYQQIQSSGTGTGSNGPQSINNGSTINRQYNISTLSVSAGVGIQFNRKHR